RDLPPRARRVRRRALPRRDEPLPHRALGVPRPPARHRRARRPDGRRRLLALRPPQVGGARGARPRTRGLGRSNPARGLTPPRVYAGAHTSPLPRAVVPRATAGSGAKLPNQLRTIRRQTP